MTTSTNSKGQQPTQRLYCVIGVGKASKWIDIGAAWPNKDGKGFSIAIHAMPLTSRIVMREISDKPEAGESQPA